MRGVEAGGVDWGTRRGGSGEGGREGGGEEEREREKLAIQSPL